MKQYTYNTLREADLAQLCARAQIDTTGVTTTVRAVLDRVQAEGDAALIDYTQKFDGVELSTLRLEITAEIIRAATSQLTQDVKQAIDQAYQNIRAFQAASMVQPTELETMPGVVCRSESRAIERVGLYVPGGSAPLVSTVLMLGIPAQLAGCTQVVLCTPPESNGSVNDAIIYAASLCGITQIYTVGGAQAIAAMAFGTATIPKVDKLFGPGNQYVTTAKQLVSIMPNGAAIDMPAGPTEVMVVADNTAVPAFVAADLLSQAEHGPDSQAVLVSTSQKLVDAIQVELAAQLAVLPRKAIAEQALQNSYVLITETIDQAITFANLYAPEHLLLQVDSAAQYLAKVRNAGSVFIGNYSCESAGDYASGTNHTLPTYGYARSYSGVSVASFQKQVTFQTVTAAGAKLLAPTVTVLAEAEGLQAHSNAMKLRIQ